MHLLWSDIDWRFTAFTSILCYLGHLIYVLLTPPDNDPVMLTAYIVQFSYILFIFIL
jgi:hypothetical protein